MSNLPGASRQYVVALRAMAVFTLVLGVGYPLVVTGIGQLAFPTQANGSLIRSNGVIVGSSLIGQAFTAADGTALPQWFQSRPSAAGYDGRASGGSNLGPNSDDLESAIRDRASAISELDGVPVSAIPADAVTASASGLDPHISPAYARLQVDRVAAARGIDRTKVAELVEHMIQGRDLGFLGEPTVDVLQLNLALAKMGSGQ